jgi:hypothetical protein
MHATTLEELKDPARRALLFRAFHHDRATHPPDWDTRMQFWRAALERECSARHVAAFDAAEAAAWFAGYGQISTTFFFFFFFFFFDQV